MLDSMVDVGGLDAEMERVWRTEAIVHGAFRETRAYARRLKADHS